MNFKPTKSNIFFFAAIFVLLSATISFSGWFSGIYYGSVVTLG